LQRKIGPYEADRVQARRVRRGRWTLQPEFKTLRLAADERWPGGYRNAQGAPGRWWGSQEPDQEGL